jgi:signal transduction histidine kinase
MRDQFLSLASHELKTPITTLQLQSDLMKRANEEPETPSMKRFMPVFRRQLVRLERLVNDLLDVSRLGSGRFLLSATPEIVDLVDLVHEVADEQKLEMDSAECQLHVYSGPPVCVKGDRIRLGQVVNNLLINARKYAPGKIILTVREDADVAIVEVKDHGPGIDEKYRDVIFERFEQAPQSRSVGGLGLGLYISREIIRFHGGELNLKSDPGDGATFWFALPKLN